MHASPLQNYGYGASVLWPEVIIRLVMEVYGVEYTTVSLKLTVTAVQLLHILASLIPGKSHPPKEERVWYTSSVFGVHRMQRHVIYYYVRHDKASFAGA